MHAVTAAIYAFAVKRRLWAAFLGSWIVHAIFNATVDYFNDSPAVVITQTVVLIIVLTALVSGRLQVPAPENS
jgi:hypothetical protein